MTKYYITKRPVLSFYVDKARLVQVSFNPERRYSTDNADIQTYLANLAAKPGCPFKEVSQEDYDAHYQGSGQSLRSKQAQILAAMAMQGGGAVLDIPKLDTPMAQLKATSTADSPLTGGQNPAGMNVTQADTVAALKAKIGGSKK